MLLPQAEARLSPGENKVSLAFLPHPHTELRVLDGDGVPAVGFRVRCETAWSRGDKDGWPQADVVWVTATGALEVPTNPRGEWQCAWRTEHDADGDVIRLEGRIRVDSQIAWPEGWRAGDVQTWRHGFDFGALRVHFAFNYRWVLEADGRRVLLPL